MRLPVGVACGGCRRDYGMGAFVKRRVLGSTSSTDESFPCPFFRVVRLSQDPGFTGMERKQPTPNSHANARSQTRREIRLEPAQTSHRLEWHVREPLRRSSRPAEKRKSLPDQKRKKRYQPPPRLPDTGALPANQFHLANDR